MIRRRRLLVGVVLACCVLGSAAAQEKSVRPGINKPFENPDVNEFLKKFEGESREIAAHAKEIVAACKLQPGMVIADVGAGTGLFTRKFAAEVGEKGKVYAVDIAPAFLRHIEKTCADAGLKNVETVLCDPFSTKLPKNSVDLIFICDTYHHFEFPQRTMQSIHDALRPGGRLVLIDFHRIPGKSREWIMEHVRAGQEVFVREITSAGFVVAGEEKFLKENYFVRFEKKAKAGAPAPEKKPEKSPEKMRRRFTIGKETTYVLGPLTPRGQIDYVAALNARLGQGVTAGSNCNALLWQALGPHPDDATMPAEFFRLLGIQPPAKDGVYFVGLHSFMHRRLKASRAGCCLVPDTPLRVLASAAGIVQAYASDYPELIERLDARALRPWSEADYPDLAAWLERNNKPLAAVVEAVRRPHYFNPLVPADRDDNASGTLLNSLLPGVQSCRAFAHALQARAMMHLSSGRHAEAWQDLLTCHRLGRQVAKGASLIELLVGIAIDSIASHASQVFLDRADLNAEQLRNCLRDLKNLPPMASAATKFELGERFMFLDAVMVVDRGGAGALEHLGKVSLLDAGGQMKAMLKQVHWDAALRNGNRWYDQLAAALRLDTRAARLE
jgi:predicted methyltransferase